MSDDALNPLEEPVQFPHYHGDFVRILFVSAATGILLTEALTDLPFSLGITMLMIVVLVIAAGITSPAQRWIQWTNLVISLVGLVVFGDVALVNIHQGLPVIERVLPSIVTVLFLIALYMSTRTVRGMMVRPV